MTQNILVNSARGTLKAKRKRCPLTDVLAGSIIGLKNHIEMVRDELDRKVRVKQLTSVAHLWATVAELSSVYRQSLVERMPKVCEAVIAAKGRGVCHILMNQKFKFFDLICL